MGAWHYAFFFASQKIKLNPANAISSLRKNKVTIASYIRPMIQSDDAHFEGCGPKIVLSNPYYDDVHNRLIRYEQLSVEFYVYRMTLMCDFVQNYSNPFLSWGWPCFYDNSLESREWADFWRITREFAFAANAAYAVIVDNAPGYVEDRFIPIDGIYTLDTYVESKFGHGFREVWVNASLGGIRPAGVSDNPPTEIGEGYLSYAVDS